MRAPRQGLHDEEQVRDSQLHRQVGEQARESVLARCLRFAQASREDVGGAAVAISLAEPELGDIARDGCLGGPEAALAEGGRELLLGVDGALLHQVADGPLAELLHDLQQGALRRADPTARARRR